MCWPLRRAEVVGVSVPPILIEGCLLRRQMRELIPGKTDSMDFETPCPPRRSRRFTGGGGSMMGRLPRRRCHCHLIGHQKRGLEHMIGIKRRDIKVIF